MNTTHLLASAPAALLLTGKARDAGNVTCGAKLESEGKAQKTGGKIQNNLERCRRRIVLSGKCWKISAIIRS